MKLPNIKNILEERRIEVSENSWDKLASQLDANDQKKRRIGFYPYAACLALLVGFVILMLTKNVGNSVSETVVETETELNNTVPNVETEKEIIPTTTEKIVVKNNTVAVQELAPKVIDNEFVVNKSIPKEKEQLEVALQKENKNAIVINKKETSPKILETVIAQKEVAIDPNKELKASIIALSASEKIKITDEEIDALLKDAQKSIQHLNIQETIDMTTIVSADDLLDEVEYELDRSFKQKVFELIKSNIQKTRTVIADSN